MANMTVCSANQPSITPPPNHSSWRCSPGRDSPITLTSFQLAHDREHMLSKTAHFRARRPAGKYELADAGTLVLEEIFRDFLIAAGYAQRRPASISHRAGPQHG